MKKKNNKKTEENSIKVKKIKGLKIKESAEDTNEIKAFLIIVVIIAILVGAIYGLTEFLKNNDKSEQDAVVAGKINYDKVSVGTILNRPYDNYYVLVYNSEDEKAVLYSTILTKYMQKSSEKDYIKIYFCDLNNNLNNKYYNIKGDNTSNSAANSIEEFNFGDLTLLQIEKGNIKKYIEDYEKIKEVLK